MSNRYQNLRNIKRGRGFFSCKEFFNASPTFLTKKTIKWVKRQKEKEKKSIGGYMSHSTF